MKKIGILGGTFDPIHLGHVALAESAISELNLDEVLIMPANKQPFKADKLTEDPSDRLKMIELAIKDKTRLNITTIELEEEGISYTFDTITKLKSVYDNCKIYFILGSDSLLKIDSWYKGKDLLKLCSFAVGLRPGDNIETLNLKAKNLNKLYGSEIYLIKNIMEEISSTGIRDRIQNNESIKGLVDKEVEKYIYEHRLYI